MKYEVFIIHIAALSVGSSDKIHPLKKAKIAHLKADEVSTKVSSKYTNFVDIFLPKLVVEFLKYMKINNHTIELVNNWQLLYGLIYSLGLVELEILKTYIKNNLANSFIGLFKSFIKIFILFDKKPNGSLKLYVDY